MTGRAWTTAAVMALLAGCSPRQTTTAAVTPVVAPQAATAVNPALALGKQLYRTGIGASGQPVKARIKGDLAEGAAIACANCHLRSGFGAQEGAQVAPPIAADTLFQPVKLKFHGVEVQNGAPRRPAYTPQTLLTALRTGVDAAGKPLADGMPRFELTDAEAAALVAYLQSLSAEASPGVEAKSVHLATVVSDDVPAADREAMLFALRKLVALKNGQAELYDVNPHDRSARMANVMLEGATDVASKRLSLAVWALHGPRASWPQQLAAYAKAEPVFALVGGIVAGSWQPVAAFAEEEGLPTLLPFAELPDAATPGWYTLYASDGVAQEGAGIAHFLLGDALLTQPPAVWQLEGELPAAVQRGFASAWQDGGKPAVAPVQLTADGLAAQVDRALAAKPQTLLLWSGTETAAILTQLAAHPNRPERVFIASGLQGDALLTLPETARPWLYVAWPWRLPEKEPPLAAGIGTWMAAPPAQVGERRYRIASMAYAAGLVLNNALMEVRSKYTRDHLMDVVGMQKDLQPPSWPRLSFGPGQRLASKGCYIVQMAAGTSLKLEAKSAWLTH